MPPSQQTGIPRIWIVAGLFTLVAPALQAWRSWVLLASYDQGIFQQVLWNSLHGHWFESTLSSQLSTNVVHAGELPSVDYERLGQHFMPTLLLWAPLLWLLGGAALPMVQVGLISSAGLVLHKLAQGLLTHRTELDWLRLFRRQCADRANPWELHRSLPAPPGGVQPDVGARRTPTLAGPRTLY